MITRSVAVLLALIALSVTDSCAEGSYRIVDGHLVFTAQPGEPEFRVPEPLRRIPGPIEPSFDRLDKALFRLTAEAKKTVLYFMEARNMQQARADAESMVRKGLERDRVAAVVVTADKPLDYRKTPEASDFINNYTVSEPKTGQTKQVVLADIFGTGLPELRAPNSGDTLDAKYPRYTLIGTRDANGQIVIQTAEARDVLEAQRFGNDRAIKDADKRASEARKEREEAEAEHRRQADLDSKKRAEAAKKKEDDAQHEAKSRREAEERMRKAERTRDSACSGGRSRACVLADGAYTNMFENVQRAMNTALCAPSLSDTGGPKGGPCANGAPPCISCLVIRNQRDFLKMEVDISRRLFVRKP